jgi:hypothetical protein
MGISGKGTAIAGYNVQTAVNAQQPDPGQSGEEVRDNRIKC